MKLAKTIINNCLFYGDDSQIVSRNKIKQNSVK